MTMITDMVVPLISAAGVLLAVAGTAYKVGKTTKKMNQRDEKLKRGHRLLHQDVKKVLKAVDEDAETSIMACPLCNTDGDTGTVEEVEMKKKKKQA